ncbi:MAG: cytochrome c [Bdellovibrionales bacterium]|nr:cytochrome c [Bdellovibrionales bacterium]
MFFRVILYLSIIFLISSCTSLRKMMMIAGENPMEGHPDTVVIGAQLFSKNCVQCHADDGSGQGQLAKTLDEQPANLQELAKRKSVKTFAANIYYGKNLMPAYKDVLSEEEIWHLANFVKSLGQ